MSGETVWVSTTSHRSRERLRQITGDPGPSFGIWPDGQWPRGSYYEVPASYVDALAEVKGLRVLRRPPSGGRLFKRWGRAEMGSAE